MRRLAPKFLVPLLVLLVWALAPGSSSAEVSVEPVSFSVTNPIDPGNTYAVRGSLFRPATPLGCNASVMLLLHGLSYGRWAWDFPINPQTYSVARALAGRGYPAVAIDELGYGASDHPNGYTLTMESYADINAQIVRQLRAGTYTAATPTAFEKVGLMGHSAGTEQSELTAGIYGGVDVLVAAAYTHFPSQRIAQDFFTGDIPRSAGSDYEYFGGTAAQREEYMYKADFSDPVVRAEDNRLANDTPSGEIFTIAQQPGKFAMWKIAVPVLLVLAEKDILFPIEYGDEELGLFSGSSDKTLHVVPNAGHSFMLHLNASATNDFVAGWLEARGAALPKC